MAALEGERWLVRALAPDAEASEILDAGLMLSRLWTTARGQKWSADEALKILQLRRQYEAGQPALDGIDSLP